MINEINNKNSTCKVLLITPINENLIPCQKLNCNLNCNRSHGIEINKNLIFSYNILDITSLIERGICFAKYEDSIWYLARIIKRIENENRHVKKFLIRYKGYDEYEEITPENIIPVCGMNIEKINDDWSDSEENYSTDSNSSSYYSDNSIDFDDFSSNTSYTDTLKILNDNNNSSFGEWEKHTKGIASHLMKKMGYEQGKGLGLNGEGIVNPIEIVIQPPGKGLDFEVDEIEELTLIKKKEQEKRKINLIKKKQRKRKLNSMESIDSDVFDFLNVSINKKAKGKQYSIENKSKIKDNIYTNNEDINKTDTHKQKKLESSSRKNKKENNLKLLQIQKQIYDLNHQIQRAKERYDRNKIRDKVVAEHYKNKIEEFKKILYTLELKEKQIKNSISDSKTLYSKFEF